MATEKGPPSGMRRGTESPRRGIGEADRMGGEGRECGQS